jgi:hypothetical protein
LISRIAFFIALACGQAFLAQETVRLTDEMTDAELSAYRDAKIAELRARLADFRPQQTADCTVFAGIFFCTVYYTPTESGFTAERGFNATSTTAPGLGGRKYPRDFLKAVKKEGFGRLTEPVNDRNYIRWVGDGRYAFAKTPTGRRGETLLPRQSCAISSRNKFLRQHMKLMIKSSVVNAELGDNEWLVCDTGSGVHPLQIDLYWGEDEPRGAVGRQRARPAGTALEFAFDVEVTARD